MDRGPDPLANGYACFPRILGAKDGFQQYKATRRLANSKIPSVTSGMQNLR